MDTGHFFITLLLTGGFVARSPPPIIDNESSIDSMTPPLTDIQHKIVDFPLSYYTVLLDNLMVTKLVFRKEPLDAQFY